MKHLRKAIQRLIRRAQNSGAGSNLRRLDPSDGDMIKRLSKTHQEAAQRLTDRVTTASVDHRNKLVKCSRERTHPAIVEFYLFFSKELMRRGYPFHAFEFHRSWARSQFLFKQGVSKARGGQSPHNYGCAVDIVHSVKFWDIPEKEWAIIGAIGKEIARKRKIKIAWGGDWRGLYDPAHWQLADWKQVASNAQHAAENERKRVGNTDSAHGEYFAWLSENEKT